MRMIDREAVIDRDIDVIGIGHADIDDMARGVDQFRGADLACLVGHPAAGDVDHGAVLDDDIGRRSDCPRPVIGLDAERDIAALGHQF